MLPSSHQTTRRLLAAAAAVLAAGLALSGCSANAEAAAGASESDDTRTISTAYGDVDVPTEPERVVAVSYETPWQLRSVGVTPIAAQDYSNYETQFTAEEYAFIEDVPSIGAFFDLNLEAVLQAEPDLIVGDVLEIDEELYEKLSAIAPTAIFEGEYRGDWQAIGAGVADAVNAADEFDAAKDAYDTRLAALQTEYEPEITGKRWAAISEGSDGNGFSILFPTGVLGALWFEDLGVTLAPGVPESNANGFEFVSPELTTAVLGEADVIVYPADGTGVANPTIQAAIADPLFAAQPAALAGDVYGVYSTVSDYTTAISWLDRVEELVLAPLAAKR